jgi:hypothetical protein
MSHSASAAHGASTAVAPSGAMHNNFFRDMNRLAQWLLRSDHLKMNLVHAESLMQVSARMYFFAYRLCPLAALRCGKENGAPPFVRWNRPPVASFCGPVEIACGRSGARLDFFHRQTKHVFGEPRNGTGTARQ